MNIDQHRDEALLERPTHLMHCIVELAPGRQACHRRATAGSKVEGSPKCVGRPRFGSAGPSRGAFVEGLRISAVSAVPRDPRDVRSGDADIGQFAVAELVELFQARVVAPPGAEEVDDCGQHGCNLSPGPLLGMVRIAPMSLRRGKCIVSIAGVGHGFPI